MAMFKIYVKPLLEYNAIIWSPTSLKYIDKCERIQQYFTRRLRGFWHVPYLSRLEQLNVELLEERRLNIDMICMYTIFNGFFNLNVSDFFVRSKAATRGYPFKVLKPACKHYFAQNFFTYRVTTMWNALPENIVCAPNINVFKQRLRHFNTKNYCKGRAFRTC